MSDLPSREEVQASMDDELGSLGLVYQIADAYVAGRLVDREAIDYEAGVSAIPDWIIYDLGSHLAPESLVRLIVDAALPDLDF